MFWRKPKYKIETLPPGEKPSDLAEPQPPQSASYAEPPKYAIRPISKPRRTMAFVVFHGMGQQVPYETQSMLAECMLEQESRRNAQTKSPDARMVRVRITDNPEDSPLARIEFTVERSVQGQAAGELIDVHIYEAYWAPLTEGKISFLETVSFLLSAGLNGIRSCLRGGAFKRWMFGDFQDLPIKGGSLLALLSAMAGLIVLLVPIGLFYFKWKKLSDAPPATLFSGHWVLSLLSLAILGLYAWGIQYFLLEYVGDVAIYVSSYKVSRFEEVRTQIHKVAFSVLRQVYSSRVAGGESENTYSDVVVVGHSLGSVIAYDALNAAMSWDSVEKGGRMDVAGRTRRLITFGSPLDKTAFLFRTQVSGFRFMREALAAQKQPLILDYKRWRPSKSFQWINIYSRADVISGKLSYYDLCDPPAVDPNSYNPVVNKPDYRAWIPFAAHVQYWQNKTLHTELFESIESYAAKAKHA